MQEDPLFLSDSTVLRKWDKGYCLSMSSEESGGRWGLFQASVKGDSLTILHVTADNAEERQKIQSILGDRVTFIAEEKDEENVDGKDERMKRHQGLLFSQTKTASRLPTSARETTVNSKL